MKFLWPTKKSYDFTIGWKFKIVLSNFLVGKQDIILLISSGCLKQPNCNQSKRSLKMFMGTNPNIYAVLRHK